MIDDEEYIVSYANLKAGLFKYQNNFLDEENLKKFYSNPLMGIPICLPIGIKYFDYSEAKFFKINKIEFSKKIFNTKKINYIGLKKYFRYGDIFAHNVRLKKKFYSKFKFYKSNIFHTKNEVSKLKKKHKKICAMQIRNAPHFGHEEIFKYILTHNDILVLNPILGIKKKNDFSDKIIIKSLKFMEKKYSKIKFLPLWSNFHYAGPREAVHHLIIRENLGFNSFYVGRDHAGAENLYKSDDAVKLVKKYNRKFNIKALTANGGYYCDKCINYVIKGECKHTKLLNISGTEFRYHLKKKIIYEHADKKLQQLIYKFL